MKSLFLFLLATIQVTFGFYGNVLTARGASIFQLVGGGARVEAQKQVDTLVNAVRAGDRDTVLSLFEATEEDKNALDSFMKNYGAIEIQLQSAQINGQGEIEAIVIFANRFVRKQSTVKWVMKKNPASPTGWKIVKVATGPVVDQNSNKQNFGPLWDFVWDTVSCHFTILACLEKIPLLDVINYEPTGREIIY